MPVSEQKSPAENYVAIREYLFSPIDIASLACFRISFGIILLVEVLRYFRHDWVARYFIEPKFHFSYYGFEWVQPWPGDGMVYHFYLLGALAICIAVGCCYRLASVLFFLSFTYVFLLDQARYLNHFYLVCLISFLLMFLPAGRAFSVDAWMRPGIRLRATPRWTVGILCAQMAIVYFFAALAKFNGDWMRGWPVMEWLADKHDTPIVGTFCTKPATALWISYAGLLFDLFVIPALLFRRTRLWAFGAAVVFHVTNMWLLHIGIFPWFSIALTTLFLDPSWPRRLCGRWLPRRGGLRGLGEETIAASRSSISGTIPRMLTLVGLTLYLAIQILLPLRHHLYPGNVNWTEEGYRFAWRMRLHTKSSQARFLVTDSGRHESWQIDPRGHLDKSQLEKMLLWPDMLVPFCHYLAERLQGEGHEKVEVRVRLASSLHGRRPELLIEPTVDLASRRRTLKHDSWLRPLTVSLSERRQPGDFLALLDPRSLERNAWIGCGAGSWVETETVIGRGAPYRELERVERISGRCYTSKTKWTGGTYPENQVLQPVVLGRLPADLQMFPVGESRTEYLNVGDRSVKCRVRTYENPLESGFWKIRIEIWTTDEIQVPLRLARAFGYSMTLGPNVMRFEMVDQAGDQPNRVTREIAELDVSQPIGKKTITTVLEKGTFRIAERTRSVRGEIDQWLSSEVPGHVARRDLRRYESDNPQRDIRVRSEVIGFEIVPMPNRD